MCVVEQVSLTLPSLCDNVFGGSAVDGWWNFTEIIIMQCNVVDKFKTSRQRTQFSLRWTVTKRILVESSAKRNWGRWVYFLREICCGLVANTYECILNPPSPSSDQYLTSPNSNTTKSRRKWSPKTKCLDVQTNSPNICDKKCVKASEENMHVDVGV